MAAALKIMLFDGNDKEALLEMSKDVR